MAHEYSDHTLVYEEERNTPLFGITMMGGMGLAAAIGGPIFAATHDDVLTGIVLVLVVAVPSFYAAWDFAKRGGHYRLTFDRRDQSVRVERHHRNKTETLAYTFSDITNVMVDESHIHGMSCYGVVLVMRDGERIPVLSSSLEHKNAECSEVMADIRRFIDMRKAPVPPIA